MKVLAIAELIWPADSTGGSLATHLHLKRLAQEGAEVTVVGPAAPPGATLVEAKLPRSRPALWLWIAKRRRWLQRLAEKHDVVYIPRYAYPMVDIAHAAGAPAVVHMHGYPTYNSLGIPGDWRLEKGAALLYAAVAHGPVENAAVELIKSLEYGTAVSSLREAAEIIESGEVPEPPTAPLFRYHIKSAVDQYEKILKKFG